MIQWIALGILEETFGNLLSDVLFGVFILVGILLGLLLRPWIGNTVLKLHPKDHRMDELDIDQETAISLECKHKKGMPPQRFLKWQPGFTGITGRIMKKPKTVFLGMEGTAYTQKPKGGSEKDGSTPIRVKLAETIKVLWGDTFYDSIPETQQKLLEESKIGVTVDVDPVLTPPDMKVITEEDIKSEQDRQACETLWKGKKQQEKGQYINLILAGGTGAAIVFALFMIGILKTPVIVVNSDSGVNGTVTSIVLSLLHFLM